MAWIAPSAQSSGDLITVEIWNQNVVYNPTLLKTSISDDGKAWANQVSQFNGLHLRSHPDSDKAQTQLSLLGLQSVMMNDGTLYSWIGGQLPLTLDTSSHGAAGQMAAAAVASTWNRCAIIGKSSTRAASDLRLFGWRMKDRTADQSQTSTDETLAMRRSSSSTRIKVGQSIQVSTAGLCERVDLTLTRSGTVSGKLWVTIEADNAGAPSGTPLATSDKIDASVITTSAQVIALMFRTPATLALSTTYWVVVQGDWTQSDTNNISISDESTGGYASGQESIYDGTNWTANSADLWFKVYITEHDNETSNATILALLPSGYDQYCRLTPFHLDGSTHVDPFKSIERRYLSMLAETSDRLLSGGTATVSTLLDASAFLPPMPVVADFVFLNGTPGQITDVCGAPEGYDITYRAEVARISESGNFPNHVFTEFQSMYYRVGAGTGYIFMSGFRW